MIGSEDSMFRSFVPCFAPAIKTNKMFASRNAKSLGFNLVVTRPPMLHPSWRASHMLWSLTRMPPLRHIDTFSPSRTSIKYDAKIWFVSFFKLETVPKVSQHIADSLQHAVRSFTFLFRKGKIWFQVPPHHSCASPQSIGTTSCCCVSWSATCGTKISLGGRPATNGISWWTSK